MRAQKSFARFRPEAQAAIIKAVEKLLNEKEINVRSSKNWGYSGAQLVRDTGAHYTYRASKQIRLLLNRIGKRWELVDIVRRSNKAAYNVSV